MITKLANFTAALGAIALIVVGIWGFSASANLAAQGGKPIIALWAIRSAAVAALAAGQLLGLNFVVVLFYEKGRADDFLRIAAGGICTIAMLLAIGLGLACK